MDGIDTTEFIARVRHWVRFIGPRRLAGGAVALVLAAAGAWLVFSPSGVPTEFSLPHASSVPDGAFMSSSTVVTGGRVTVHVTGAVAHPGVYVLDAEARVVDAVRAAGGSTRAADLERINLALRLVDTEQVWVPSQSSRAPRATVAPRLRTTHTTVRPSVPGVTTIPSPDGTPSSTSGGRINVNTASASQLEQLPGVGPATAQAIVDYRRRNGPFAKVDDLDKVPGIGPAKVAAMKSKATVG